MAWQDDINTPMKITTGDGRVFVVAWQPVGFEEEYNVATFDFNNVAGSYIAKGQRKGRKYPVKLFFQGADYIQDVKDFLQSVSDTMAMNVQHPLYGPIICQVAALGIDDSKLNVSEITCTFLETITGETPVFTQAPVDKIAAEKATNDQVLIDGFNVTPSTKDKNTMTETNRQLYAKGNRLGSTESYSNLFIDANSAVLNATSDPIAAMRRTQALINAPASFTSGVKSRIGTITEQFNSLRATVAGITNRSGKKVYEVQGATLVSSMAYAASTPQENDYANKTDVLNVIGPVISVYNNYILDLQALQSDNGGTPDAYIPDPDSIYGLNALINFTVSQLFNIALNAKQQRTIILEDDSNWIILAHRFYRISNDSHEVELLMDQNGASISEILQVKKGRNVVYYV